MICLENGELRMVDLKEGIILNRIKVEEESSGLVGFKTAAGGFFISVFGGSKGWVFEIIPGKSVSGDGFDITVFRYVL